MHDITYQNTVLLLEIVILGTTDVFTLYADIHNNKRIEAITKSSSIPKAVTKQFYIIKYFCMAIILMLIDLIPKSNSFSFLNQHQIQNNALWHQS